MQKDFLTEKAIESGKGWKEGIGYSTLWGTVIALLTGVGQLPGSNVVHSKPCCPSRNGDNCGMASRT